MPLYFKGSWILIYTNGCSYSMPNGGPSWSEHLSSLIGIELHAAGQSGSSNERIFRNTIYDLLQNDKITKVVISLTFENRFDIFYQGEFISITPGYTNLDFPLEYREYIKYRMLIKTMDELLISLFSNLVALKSFVESRNAQFFVFWAADQSKFLTKQTSDKIKNTLMLFNSNNSFDLLNFSFCKFAVENNLISDEYFKLGIDSHPPPQAHEKLAKMIYERIK